MYLAILNKKQKQAFLAFAYCMATSDGVYSEEEQLFMQSYCDEMKIPLDLEGLQRSAEEAIQELDAVCDLRAKKICIFEAIGLAACDQNYDENERALIRQAMMSLGIDEGFDAECEKMINEYLEFQNKVNTLVLGT